MYRQYTFIALVLAANRFEEPFPEERESDYFEPEGQLCRIEEYQNRDSIAFRWINLSALN